MTFSLAIRVRGPDVNYPTMLEVLLVGLYCSIARAGVLVTIAFKRKIAGDAAGFANWSRWGIWLCPILAVLLSAWVGKSQGEEAASSAPASISRSF